LVNEMFFFFSLPLLLFQKKKTKCPELNGLFIVV
jgi:hypothetical protein